MRINTIKPSHSTPILANEVVGIIDYDYEEKPIFKRSIMIEEKDRFKIKTWELTIDIVNRSNNYMTFDILPALMFIKDKQMSNYDKNINEEPYIAYSLLFQWLGFYIDLTYNRKL